MINEPPVLRKVVEKVAETAGVSVDTASYERLKNIERWDSDRLKKIWVSGTKLDDNRPILLKIRPANSIISKEEFVRTETVEAQITSSLAELGLTVPETISTQFDDDPQWTVRYYLSGQPIGNNSIRQPLDEKAFLDFLVSQRSKLDTITDKINPRLLNQHNFYEKWFKEFGDRYQMVVGQLGQSAADTLEKAIKQPASFETKKWLLHNDLVPQNILRTETGYVAIDWGEATLGPRAVDWAMIWSFALDQPNLRQQLVRAALAEASTEIEQEEVKHTLLALAARMVGSFAEWFEHYTNHPEESARFPQVSDEAIAALPKAWRNFQELQSQLEQ